VFEAFLLVKIFINFDEIISRFVRSLLLELSLKDG
jgi:hypothetical protein